MIGIEGQITTIVLTIIIATIGLGLYIVLFKKKGCKMNSELEFILFRIIPIVIIVANGVQIANISTLNSDNAKKEKYYEELHEAHYDKFNLTVEYGDTEFLWHPENVTPNEVDKLEFKALEVGKIERIIKAKDKDNYELELKYNIDVIDTHKPVIKGVKDIELSHDEKFDIKRLNITADDKVDGPLKLNYKHDKIDKPGKYTVNVSAKDTNGNVTTESFTVTVKDKSEGSASPRIQDYQTIKFNNGREIYYYNKGKKHGQKQIDVSPWTATTWDLPGFALTHNNNDGIPTYFAGHHYDAFEPVQTMDMGDTFTIRDHTGDITTYEAVNSYSIEMLNDVEFEKGTEAIVKRLHSFVGEGVLLPTWNADNPDAIIIIEARPV